MNNVLLLASKKIIEAKYFMPIFQEGFAEVRTNKASATSNQNTFFRVDLVVEILSKT
jgi:hypothetical protein